MVTIEQVRLLETKVSRAVDYIENLTEENNLLKGKLDGYHKQIGELELLIQRFKEDHARIEEGVISALNQLSRFEIDADKNFVRRENAHDAPSIAPKSQAETAALPASPAAAWPEAEDDADENDDAPFDEAAILEKADDPDTEMFADDSLDDAQLLELSDAAGKPSDGNLDIF